MLPPEYLESLPDAVIELIQEMEDARIMTIKKSMNFILVLYW